MGKNILITGGAGFIGSNLASSLIERGHDVTVLDNLSSQVHGEDPDITSPLYISVKDKVRFIKGNITDTEILKEAVAGQDLIIHFAAETGTGQSMYEIHRYTDVNIGGTALLLDILTNNEHSVKKIVVASSRAIYGEGRYRCVDTGRFVYPLTRREKDMSNGDFEVKYDGCRELELVATTEDSAIHPSSVYGITKQVQEQMIMTVCPTIGIAPVALRYQNVYGPGQSLTNPYTGILSIFSTRIRCGRGINIFEDGRESRDFIYIDDVVRATILAIEKNKADGNIFNVGTGIPIDVLTVARTLMDKYDAEVPMKISGNYRVGDIRHNYADITKIQNYLGFRPEIGFDEGISRFAEWVNGQEIIKDEYEKSLEEMEQRGLYK